VFDNLPIDDRNFTVKEANAVTHGSWSEASCRGGPCTKTSMNTAESVRERLKANRPYRYLN